MLNYSPYISLLDEILIELHDILTTHVLNPIKWVDNHKVIKVGFAKESFHGIAHYGSLTSSRADDMENGQCHLSVNYPDY